LSDRPWKAHRVLCVPFLLLEVILQPVWSCGRGEGAAWAQTAAEEDVPQLAAWLREPLDLRHADADELALLPWLDAGLGRAIVGLREAGGLHRMDDLLRIPGLDRERLEAIEPFVRLPGGVAWASRIEAFSRWRRAGGSGLRTRIDLRRGDLTLAAQRNSPPSLLRAALRWQRGRLVLAGGDLRPGLAWPLLLADPSLRTRTAPPPLGRRDGVRSALSAAVEEWRGMAAEASLASMHLLLVAGRDGSGATRSLVLVEHRGALDGPALGAALLGHGGLASWLRWESEGVRARVESVASLRRGEGGRLCAALRVRRGATAFGFALTASDAHRGVGQDPITGQLLDRRHRVAQAHLRLHPGRWTVSVLGRVRRRGRIGQVVDDRRWQIECAGPLGVSRLRLRWRQDEGEAGEAHRVFGVWWVGGRDRRAWRPGLRLRHERVGASVSLLGAFDLQGGESWSWKLQLALSRGDRSAPWSAGVPVSGLSSTWLAPRGVGVLVGVARRVGAGRLGLWLRLRQEAGGAFCSEGGAGLRLNWKGGS